MVHSGRPHSKCDVKYPSHQNRDIRPQRYKRNPQPDTDCGKQRNNCAANTYVFIRFCQWRVSRPTETFSLCISIWLIQMPYKKKIWQNIHTSWIFYNDTQNESLRGNFAPDWQKVRQNDACLLNWSSLTLILTWARRDVFAEMFHRHCFSLEWKKYMPAAFLHIQTHLTRIQKKLFPGVSCAPQCITKNVAEKKQLHFWNHNQLFFQWCFSTMYIQFVLCQDSKHTAPCLGTEIADTNISFCGHNNSAEETTTIHQHKQEAQKIRSRQFHASSSDSNTLPCNWTDRPQNQMSRNFFNAIVGWP